MFLSSNFLGIPPAENTLEKSRVVVLPCQPVLSPG